MKTLMIMAAAASIATAAHSADYVSADYSNKDKAHSTEVHDLFGVTYGHTIHNGELKGITVEGRMEDQIVNRPGKHEGLFQAKAIYPINYNFYGVKPYVATTIGYNSRANTNFMYYALEAGGKYTLTPRVDVKAAVRLRAPFNENLERSIGNHYHTVETSGTVSYKFTRNDVVAAKAAIETGDVHYRIFGLALTHSF